MKKQNDLKQHPETYSNPYYQHHKIIKPHSNSNASSQKRNSSSDKQSLKSKLSKPKSLKNINTPTHKNETHRHHNKNKKQECYFQKSGDKHSNIYTGQEQELDIFQQLNAKSFNNLSILKLKLLTYIFKNRLIKDEQYNDLYQKLTELFPDKEQTIKTILFEIVSSLDS